MESLTDFSMQAIEWLQQTYPGLEGLMIFFTTLGNEEAFLLILPVIYWCINKRLGRELNYLFFISVALNTLLKQSFRQPRPYWLDPDVAEGGETAGFGLPSGHAQYAAVLYLFIAMWFKKWWLWLFALFMAGMIGFSRLYLGQHFIQDIIAGYLVGLLMLGGYVLWQRTAGPSFGKRILGQKMLVAVALPFLFGVVYAIVRLLLGAPDPSAPYYDWTVVADLSSFNEMVLAVALLLGVGIGFLLEASRVRFRADGPISKRILRYILGVVVLAALAEGLGAIFPRDPLWLGIPLRFVRYLLLGLWASYWAPWVFVKLRLADADPDPGIHISLREETLSGRD